MWYHASPYDDLHLEGIKGNCTPLVGWRRSPYIFLGTLKYLSFQYFQYAPKGTYFIYEIDTDGLDLDHTPVGEQCKFLGNIPSSRVQLYAVRDQY